MWRSEQAAANYNHNRSSRKNFGATIQFCPSFIVVFPSYDISALQKIRQNVTDFCPIFVVPKFW